MVVDRARTVKAPRTPDTRGTRNEAPDPRKTEPQEVIDIGYNFFCADNDRGL